MSAARIDSIFHPSDFSHASEIAFVHALKIALITRATLHMLHADGEHNADWSDFPGVRTTLARWGLIPPDSPKSAVIRLGIDVGKIIAPGKPLNASLDFLERHHVDLIVLAVRQLEGRMRWLEARVGEPMMRRAEVMTLFLPEGVRGFVSRDDGSTTLRNILIPVAAQPRAEPAVEAVKRLIDGLQLATGSVTLLHVGSRDEAPMINMPAHSAWRWEYIVKEGRADEVILATAQSMRADLIALTTDGREGFLDALRGSTSERVLRSSRCPMLCLPA